MNKYANIRTYPLRYSDFDFKDEVKFSALLDLLQESACRSADELHFGYDDLRPHGFGFIVVNTYVEFVRPIRLGDTPVVETWPLPPRHVIFERAYRIADTGGEPLAAAVSRWCLVDLTTFSLLTPDRLGAAHTACPYRDEHTASPPSWKIPRREGREVRRMIVGSSQCDHYFHANNARYADFFLDCFSIEELKSHPIRAFQIAYVKQAKEGSEIVFSRADAAGETSVEARIGNEVITQFRVFYEE